MAFFELNRKKLWTILGIHDMVLAGYEYTMAIKENGSLWGWGRNQLYQIGDGSSNNIYLPTLIGDDEDWQSVSPGRGHTMALKKDGSLWAWGFNDSGQLGVGTIYSQPMPQQVDGSNWQSVAAGYSHTIATKEDKSLWAWGFNAEGQLGDDYKRDSPTMIWGTTYFNYDIIQEMVEIQSFTAKRTETGVSIEAHMTLKDGSMLLPSVIVASYDERKRLVEAVSVQAVMIDESDKLVQISSEVNVTKTRDMRIFAYRCMAIPVPLIMPGLI